MKTPETETVRRLRSRAMLKPEQVFPGNERWESNQHELSMGNGHVRSMLEIHMPLEG